MATKPSALPRKTAPLQQPSTAALPAGSANLFTVGQRWCASHCKWRDLGKLQLNSDGDFTCTAKQSCLSRVEVQLPSPPRDGCEEATTTPTCGSPHDPVTVPPIPVLHDPNEDGEAPCVEGEELRCWNCDRPGHLARQCCPSPPLNHGACYECGGADHHQWDCPILRIELEDWIVCALHDRPRGRRNIYWCEFLRIWRCKSDQQCTGLTTGHSRATWPKEKVL